MVGVTAVLARIPVIKFRKGGLGQAAAGPARSAVASALGSCPASAAPRAAAAKDDTEITVKRLPEQNPQKAAAIIRIPKGVLIESGKQKAAAITMNIIIQKANNSEKT